jgi:hypothetical protein
MKLDDASWHLSAAGDEKRAIAHIALFFRWCVDSGFLSDEHTSDPELRRELNKVKAGTLSTSDYLWENTSGKFGDSDITAEAVPFVKWYYNRKYVADLRALTGKRDYEVDADQVDYQALSRLLDTRRSEWASRPPKPWWQFW